MTALMLALALLAVAEVICEEAALSRMYARRRGRWWKRGL